MTPTPPWYAVWVAVTAFVAFAAVLFGMAGWGVYRDLRDNHGRELRLTLATAAIGGFLWLFWPWSVLVVVLAVVFLWGMKLVATAILVAAQQREQRKS